jgi:putative addiction module killer protein
MVPLSPATILEYLDSSGRSLYAAWFNGLNAHAAAKVAVFIARLAHGNFSTTKSVGRGVYECRINFGPGFRVYFGKDGERLVILLGGGSKKGQQKDIRAAIDRWQDYKKRKIQMRQR